MICRPILFSAEMVRAILDGRKTQTRRAVKQVLVRLGDGDRYAFDHHGINYRVNARRATEAGWANLLQFCPYGRPGDRLWVRETTVDVETHGYVGPVYAESEEGRAVRYYGLSPAPDDVTEVNPEDIKLRPSIFMPRSMTRITLEITGVRVERLHDITISESIAEGYDGSHKSPLDPSIAWYADLWESINGPGSWRANPWVWVIEFQRIVPR